MAHVLGVFNQGRERHKSPHADASFGSRGGLQQRLDLVLGYTVLGLLIGHVHLDENVGPALGGPPGDPLDQTYRVHRMYERDPRYDDFRFSPLHVANKVPLEAITEHLLLLHKVLGPVLAHQVNVSPGKLPELLRRVVFGRDEHPYCLARASTTLQGTLYVLAHDGEPFLYVCARHARAHPASLTIEARFR